MFHEGSSKTPFFNAFCKIEISSMRAAITRFVTESLTRDLEPAVEEAVVRAFDDGWWKAELNREVERSIKELISSAVRGAIEQNFELRGKVQDFVYNAAADKIAALLKEKSK